MRVRVGIVAGDTRDVPSAEVVCDEFCAMLDRAVDAVWTCDRDACDAQMTDARDLMKNVAGELESARGSRSSWAS